MRPSLRHRESSERGSVLVGTIILGLLFLSILIGYSQWSNATSEALVHRSSSQRALEYAESGVNSASMWLKNPSLNTQLPVNSTATVTFGPFDNGRVETTFNRTFADTNLVDSYTTAYYYISKGSMVDPLTGQSAQMAVINVKYKITNLAQFMFAVPGPLHIDLGAQIPAGIVYANDLYFSTTSLTTHTAVAMAWYLNSINPPVLTGVDFGPGAPQQLSYPPNFTTLDDNVSNFYQNKASQLPLPPFEGPLAPASDSHVYFSSGDVTIGLTQPLTVSGVYVIYAKGNVTINSDILLADANSWVGIMSEKAITLTATGNTLTLNGNFVANWGMSAVGSGVGSPFRPGSTLIINGGIVSYTEPQFHVVWDNRTYNYKNTTDSNLILPNFSNLIEYKILKGKYNQ